MKRNQSVLALFVGASLLAVGSLTVYGANRTWSGASGSSANWNDALNWDALPGNGDSLIFAGAAQLMNTNDFAAFSGASLAFANGDFVCYGNAITLIGGITNSAGNNALNLNVTLGASQRFESVSAGQVLTLGGAINNGANDLTVGGAGDVAWTMNATQGLKAGAGSLIKEGTGTLAIGGGFFFPAAGPNFPGNTIVNGGTLSFNVGCFDGNSPMGQSLTISPGGTVTVDQPHIAGSNGRPLKNYGGTFTLNNETYLTSVTLSNATVNGTDEIRGNGGITNLASAGPTVWSGNLLLGTRTLYVEDGLAEPDLEFQGVISGAGALNKFGAGKLLLNGACTYSGETLINAGTLAIGPSGSIASGANITVGAGATFDVLATGYTIGSQTLSGGGTVLGDFNNGAGVISPGSGAATLTFSNTLTLQGAGGSLNFELANMLTVGGGTNDLLVVSNLVISGPTTVNISFLNGVPNITGPYTLIQYQAFTGNVTDFTASPSRYSFTFTNDTAAKAIKVYVTGVPSALTWQGDSGGNAWDVASSFNWTNAAGSPDVFLHGDNVTFNNNSANTAVDVAIPVQPQTVTVNSSQDYTLMSSGGSGSLDGGGSLIKQGSGTLTLAVNNTMAGNSILGGGTVFVGNGGASGGLGTGFTTNNTKVVFNRTGTYAYTGTLVGSGGVTISNGTVQLGSGGTSGNILNPITNYTTLAVSRSDSPSVPGPIVGTGGINLAGASSVRLNNVNVGGQLNVGNSGGVSATLSVGSGDSVTVNRLYVGEGGGNLGVINQSGGVINVTDSTDTEGPMRLGHWGSATSTYNMTGGQLIITNGVNSRLSIGIDGVGIWNVNGGAATVNRVDINGRNATGGGFLNLTNGSIVVGGGGIIGNAPYTFNLAGGTFGASANWSSSVTGNLVNASSPATFDTGPNTITYSGRLQGPGGLVKQGAGTLALTGAGAYTGPTTVSNGTLTATTLVSPVTVYGSGVLGAGAPFVPAILGITNNLSLNTGAGLVFDLGNTNSPGGVNDLILVQSNLTLSGSVPVAFNFLGAPYTAGPYTLITNVGSQVGSATLFVTNNQSRLTPAFSTTANSVRVQFSGSGANLVWKGDGSGNLWDLGTTNWLRGGLPDRFFQADTVSFDDTGFNTPNVSLVGPIVPVAATVNASNNYVWSGTGKLSGGAALTKSGTGKLTLGTDNDFAGPLNVTAGTLEIGNGGNTGSITTTAVTNNATITYNRTNAQSIAYNTRGSGVMVKENTNTLTTTSAQALTGGIVVNRGTMRSTVGNFGGTLTPVITINTNGTFLTDVAHASGGGASMFINRGTWLQNFEDYKQNVTMVDGLIATGGAGNGGEYRVGFAGAAGNHNLHVSNSIAGSVINQRINTVTANNNLHVNATRGVAPSDLTLNGQVYGAGNININGNGIVTLNTNNAHSGTTRITGGRLVLGVNGGLTNTSAITVLSPGILDITAANLTFAQYRVQSLQGNGGVVGDFTDNVPSVVAPGNSYISGTTNVNAPGTLTFSNNVNLGGGVWAFKLFNPAFVGAGVNDLVDVKGNLNIFSGASLALSTNGNPQPGTYQVIKYAGPTIPPGFITPAPLPYATRYSVSVDDTQPGHVDMIVGGSAGSLVWSGDGVANAWDLTTTPNWNANSEYFYNWDNVTFDDTSSNNNVSNSVAVVPALVTVNNPTKNYSFTGSGKITGTAALTKTGAGTLTLNNRHDYAGPTIINGGVLALNLGGSAGTLNGGSPVTVNSGGTLLSLVNDSFGFGLGTKINTLNVNGGSVLHAANNNVSMWGIVVTMTGGSMAATNTGGSGRLDIGSDGGFMPFSTLTTLASASPATIGGQRFNLRQSLLTNNVADGAAAKDLVINTSFTGNGNTWVKQGAGTLSLEGSVDNASLNLRVEAGTVLLEKASSASVHAVGSVLTINGGTVKETGAGGDQIFNNAAVTLNGGVLDLNGNNETIDVLNGSAGIVRNDLAATTSTLTIGQNNGSSTFGSVVQNGAGTMAFTKAGTGTATLTNINAYTGNTTVSGGTLALVAPMSVSASPVLTVGAGSTLNVAGLPNSSITNGVGQLMVGGGTVAGSLRVNGTLYVGNTNNIGTLTVTTNLALTGTTFMELSKVTGLTNDQCVVGGTVTFGGTLTVAGLGGAYAPGDTFKLFTAAVYNGSFTTLNLPVGVVWNTSNLGVNGTITIVSVNAPAITSGASLGAGGFQLNLSGPAGNNYRVLTQTNAAATPVATTWTPLVTNLFGPSGTATFTDVNATNFLQRFYLIAVP